MGLMSLFSITYNVMCVITALFFITIGLKVIHSQRPLILSSRHFFALICLVFLPQILQSAAYLLFSGMSGSASLVRFVLPLAPILMLFFFWFQMQGYVAIGISSDSFRKALHDALNRHNIPFEEQLASITLPSLNTTLEVSAQYWLGTGQLELKNRQHHAVLKQIVQGLNIYYQNNAIQAYKLTAIFYLIFGVVMLLLAFVLSGL